MKTIADLRESSIIDVASLPPGGSQFPEKIHFRTLGIEFPVSTEKCTIN
jgi:hypothetical protein